MEFELFLLQDIINPFGLTEALGNITGISEAYALDTSGELNLNIPLYLLYDFPIADIELFEFIQFLNHFLADLNDIFVVELIDFLVVEVVQLVAEVFHLQVDLDYLQVYLFLV